MNMKLPPDKLKPKHKLGPRGARITKACDELRQRINERFPDGWFNSRQVNATLDALHGLVADDFLDVATSDTCPVFRIVNQRVTHFIINRSTHGVD